MITIDTLKQLSDALSETSVKLGVANACDAKKKTPERYCEILDAQGKAYNRLVDALAQYERQHRAAIHEIMLHAEKLEQENIELRGEVETATEAR